jgi:hypothetical protein
MFWEDQWYDAPLKDCLPKLFSLSKKQHLSLNQVKNSHLPDLFFQPLSEQAFNQLSQLQDILSLVNISDIDDRWTYIWGSRLYSSSKAYRRRMTVYSLTHKSFG